MREMGNKAELDTKNGREMGNETEFEMGLNGKRGDTRCIIFQQKNGRKKLEKQGKIHKKSGKNRKKNKKKTENYKKYRNEISTRFQEMLKTETSFRRDFGKC